MRTVLLVGSSIFEAWANAAEVGPGHHVVNRAVGGATTGYWRVRRAADALRRLERGEADAALVGAATVRRWLDLASRDPLTGLPNRRHLDAVLPQAVALAARHREPLSLVLFDLAGLKRLNETRGYRAGDAALRRAARALRACARRSDVVARLGGDEFAALLPRTGAAGAAAFARRACAAAAGPRRARVALAWGVGELGAARTARALFDRADRALRAAKWRGRRAGAR